jgi:hypothetical protein
MSMTMEDDIKRWTAKRKAALVMVEIFQGKTSISEASRAFDVSPAEIEEWVDEAKRGMESALKAKPLDIKESSISILWPATGIHHAAVCYSGVWGLVWVLQPQTPTPGVKEEDPEPGI